MAEYKKVSVVLTTYNGEKYLSEQLQSLVNQSYPNIEIVAVDDRSSDNTVDILNQFAEKYNHIKVFVNKTNLGFIKNFEKACGLATGEFIALCDQDDWWHHEKIMRLAEAIGDSEMVFCDSAICDENLRETGKRISTYANFKSGYSCVEMAVFCRIYGHTTLFKKTLFAAASPFLDVIPHDWWLCYVATLNGNIKYLNDCLVRYRQHSTNAFGAVGGKSRKNSKIDKRQKKLEEIKNIRKRIAVFYDMCPPRLANEKKILFALKKSYQSFSLPNNILRMFTFFSNYKALLFVKKRALLRKYLFCFKMFIKIK